MSYKGLQRLNGTLRALADVPSQASRDAAERIGELIDDALDAGLDPYGRALEPLAATTLRRHPHRVGGVPLTDTGAMRASLRVTPKAGAGIDITIDAPANFHNTGTKYMPQRQIIPQSGGIAPAWRDAIAEAVSDNVKKALG